jgi:chemotaxis signal transduction protein
MGAVKETNPPRQGQYLTFYVAGEEYAINILKVKEILNTTRSQWCPILLHGLVASRICAAMLSR